MIESIETPLGPMSLAAKDGSLVALYFDERRPRSLDALIARFASLPRKPARSDFAARVARYFDGDVEAIDAIPTNAEGTPFQTRVWQALRTIPVGRTVSYADIAEQIGQPTATRAVGLANGQNPITLVVPCHRVIAKSGALSGYGASIPRKKWLLAHERTYAPARNEVLPLFAIT